MTDLTEDLTAYGKRLAGERYASHEAFITDVANHQLWDWQQSIHFGNWYAVTPYGYHVSTFRHGDFDPDSYAAPNYWKVRCNGRSREGYSAAPLAEALRAMIEMQLDDPQPTLAAVREAAASDRHIHARLPYADD